MTAERDPKLSVVIAAWNETADLERCLASLSEQADDRDIEIIAVSNAGAATSESIGKRFPRGACVSLSAGATVPELRARGIASARGEIVALLEDTCAVDAGWYAEIMRAHAAPHAAIGGAIEHAGGARPLDWAVYFFDYGKYMQPNQAGAIDSLPGINVSYKRSAIELAKKTFASGLSETFIHEELKRQGQELYLSPSAIVYFKKNHNLNRTLTQFFHLARSYGAKRVVHVSQWKRLIFAIGSCALPILLPARIARRIIQKGRNIGPLLLSFPCLLLLMASWSAGEFFGYVWGEGSSAGRWK
jgi:GT2 family glycosyltransferase